MGIFKKKQEIRADPGTAQYEDALLTALLGGTGVTKAVALQIPTVQSAIGVISGIVAATPIKLYEEVGGKVLEVKGDARVKLLNDETGDTLTSNDFWKAMISDYYLGKGGYAYINKGKGAYKSLHYVDETYISIKKNTDPIFKDYDILVNGVTYKPYDFLKILRNTKDGASGTGIVTENSKILEVAYESLVFESNLVKKGGNKKGFLKSEQKIDAASMTALRAAFQNLYSNNSENVVVLNKGIEFKESSNTSVELQLNENKKTNSEEIGKILHVSPGVISGNATESEINSLAKLAVIPLMKTIECALNRDFLLEKEKKSFYFAFDTKELLKGSLLDRYRAYEIAVRNGWKMRSEIRYAEDDAEIDGLDVISMSLADVIYDPETKTYFTPNTKVVTDAGGKETPPSDGNAPIEENVKDGINVETDGTVASISLNGAQIQSLLQIVVAVASNTLQYDSAVTLITSAFPFDDATAKEILGNPSLLTVPGDPQKEGGEEI